MSARHDDYRVDWRNTRPGDVRDGEPRSLIDSWPFLVCGIVIAACLLAARAWGWV